MKMENHIKCDSKTEMVHHYKETTCFLGGAFVYLLYKNKDFLLYLGRTTVRFCS